MGFEKDHTRTWTENQRFVCTAPEHNVPSHIVLPPGAHIYTCPACGAQRRVIVERPVL